MSKRGGNKYQEKTQPENAATFVCWMYLFIYRGILELSILGLLANKPTYREYEEHYDQTTYYTC